MKKILILGGAQVHCKLVEAAHELGLYVIVTDYLREVDAPAKLIADKSYQIDINNVEQIVQLCKFEEVDAVITSHLDPCQKPYAEICSRLELPCLGTAEQFQYLTNKRMFKEECKKNGVCVIDEYTRQEIENDQVEYPVFVKPVDSRGSRGQKKCSNKQEVLKAIEGASIESSNGDYLIERYLMDKEEIQITYFFVNGTPYLIRTADSFRENSDMKNVVTYSVSPSKYTLEYLEKAHSQIINMLVGLGIKNGPVMIQGFYDAGVFRFFDQGLRFPGVDYERIYKNEYKVDLLKLMIQYSLTGYMPDILLDKNSVYLNGKKAYIVFPLISAGKIGRIEGIGNIKKNKKVMAVLLRHVEGDEILWTYDINHRLCEIDILLEKEETFNDVKSILSELKVLDINQHDMLLKF